MLFRSNELAITSEGPGCEQWILNILEQYLERPLSPADIDTATFIYSELGFSSDLIFFLYDYCISRGKRDNRYIQKVAISWADKQVDCVEKAEAVNNDYHEGSQTVSRAFGFNRSLAQAEMRFVKLWFDTWHMDPSLIEEACSRSVLQTGKPSFEYAHSIIENWYKQGVTCLEQVKRLDQARKAAREQKMTPIGQYQSKAPF